MLHEKQLMSHLTLVHYSSQETSQPLASCLQQTHVHPAMYLGCGKCAHIRFTYWWVLTRAGFHLGGVGGRGGEGRSPPLNLFWPPLIEIAVVLFLRSNPFLAPPYDKKQSFRPLGMISK